MNSYDIFSFPWCVSVVIAASVFSIILRFVILKLRDRDKWD